MLTTTATLTHKYDSPSEQVSLVLFQVEETFAFQEWQFVMIEKELNGKLTRKPYSIATTNIQMQEEKTIGFVVKKTSENGMSSFLTQQITLGDTINIKGPVWHYVDSFEFPNYLFISTGSGLSPNVGLFQHLVYESKRYEKIVNIFGERFYSHIIPEVENLFVAHDDDRIQNMFYLSQEEFPLLEQEDFLVGDKRVGLELYRKWYVQEWLAKAVAYLWPQTSCFLCGIPAMVDDVQKKLIALWIPKEQISFEKY